MSNIFRRDRWDEACINPASGLRQYLSERDLHSGHIDRIKFIQIGAHKAAIQRCSNIIRMSLNHERKVEEARFRQVEASDYIPQKNPRDDSRARRTQPSPQWNRVLDVHM